ncbi:carbohydrate-binding module family 20 domain-containing protein [Microbulbifer agarilyticus]
MKPLTAGMMCILLAGITCQESNANTRPNDQGYYHIDTVYASGYLSRVSYQTHEIQPPSSERQDRFSILLENDNRVVLTTEHVFLDERNEPYWTKRHQCVIDEQSDFYPAAIELVYRQMEVKGFHVHFSVTAGQSCQSLENIEYRHDVTQVYFSCHNGHTYWGQSVYVVGNTELLGNWDPAKAVRLDSNYYPSWQKTTLVESGKDIEWKCIKREEQNPSAGIIWQPGANNYFFSDNASSQQAIF